MTEKLCTGCYQTKDRNLFHRDRTTADGRNHYCKECQTGRMTRAYKKRVRRDPVRKGEKRCGQCEMDKPVADFAMERSQKDGLNRLCRPCQAARNRAWHAKNPKRGGQHASRYRKLHPERSADYCLKKNYRIPFGTYDTILAEQGGRCAICRSDKPGRSGVVRFAVDHCHTSGKIRGLLCHTCNLGIGYMKHDVDLLSSAMGYLRRTQDYPNVAVNADVDSILQPNC